MYGYRFGGEFQVESNETHTLEVKESSAVGVSVSFYTENGKGYGVLYSKNKSSIRDVNGILPSGFTNELSTEYLHLVGTAFTPLNTSLDAYYTGSIGLTRFSTPNNNYESSTDWSLGLAFGLQQRFHENIALRAGINLYGTPTSKSGGFICGGNGGCSVLFASSLFFQYEPNVSLVFSF